MVAGAILLLFGLILSDNLNSFLLLLTHMETPPYVKDKPGVSTVRTYIKGIGILFKVLGVGLTVYGLIVIGMFIFKG